MNQDSRRKLKQVYHLFQFIEPLLREVARRARCRLAGGPWRGQVLSRLHPLRPVLQGPARGAGQELAHLWHRNARGTGGQLAGTGRALGFAGMSFLNLVGGRVHHLAAPCPQRWTWSPPCTPAIPPPTTPSALRWPGRPATSCWCRAARPRWPRVLRKHKGALLAGNPLTEIWRHPLHTREFGSQVTNVLRCLQLEAHGYQVSVTELVGWGAFDEERADHRPVQGPAAPAAGRPSGQNVLETLGLDGTGARFFTPAQV